MSLLICVLSFLTFTACTQPASTDMADTTGWPGYRPLPLIKPFARVAGGQVELSFTVVDNPGRGELHTTWTADPENPEICLIRTSDGTTSVDIPNVDGDYFFDLRVRADSDSVSFRTYVTRRGDALHAFDIDTEYAAWVDDAVVYQVTPNSFIRGGTYDDITEKLPEVRSLGVNTLYLQPVYKTQRGGQGYDIIDYFSLRSDLGTEEQLQRLISAARDLGMRVLFDFVPNHTSIHHPYAESVKRDGQASPHYGYYQHTLDGASYSSHYQTGDDGFVRYFWKDLVNLNFDNEEVQRWIIEACKYWVRKFDIDGYRFDAVWAVNARNPSFGNRLRLELKAIKPDLFLLAEDKPIPSTFNSGFDAAYDWTPDTIWVSQWSWQTDFDERESKTVFNFHDVARRVDLLREATFKSGCIDVPCLRFMENNDLPRFEVHHSEAQVGMVAALLFSLPGIPMLYNGQEVGVKAHPYTRHTVFSRENSIRSASPERFDMYKRLIGLRNKHVSLRTGEIEEVAVASAAPVLGFRRWHGNEQFLILINLAEERVSAKPSIRAKGGVIDVLTGQVIRMERVEMEPYSARWLRID